MSQSGIYGSGGGGGGGITTINGDVGSVTGSTVTLTTGGVGANGTAFFSGSGSTMTLNASDQISGNVAWGPFAFSSVPTGTNNTAIGYGSAGFLTTGSSNTLVGNNSGGMTTGSSNCTLGLNALNSLTRGNFNLAMGNDSGGALTSTESSNIYFNSQGVISESNALRIGSATGTSDQNLNSAFICGIQGIVVAGDAVLISNTDQLGVAASSKRFKTDIQDMGSSSDVLHKLRPVSFVWKKDSSPGLQHASTNRQFGLIAEEAITHVPHAVNIDKGGQPFNINYQDLIGMMINEIQKLRKEVDLLKKGG